MKQKLLFGFAVLTIVAVAAFTMNVNSNDYGLSDISLTNMEALAISEGNSDCEGCLQWYNAGSPYFTGVKCKSNGCTEEYKGICEKWCN